MKLTCSCGAIIPDSTDYMHNKGYIIPDQDLHDLREQLEVTKNVDLSTIWKFTKSVFQCDECGALIVENDKEFHIFKSDDSDKSKNVIRSVF